jgi:tetrahydromethanopterin S-methyltransferase subunit E
MDFIPVIVRIFLRYVSGALVAYGVLPAEVGAEMAMDQELALVLGTALGALVEGAYAWVKARGGRT